MLFSKIYELPDGLFCHFLLKHSTNLAVFKIQHDVNALKLGNKGENNMVIDFNGAWEFDNLAHLVRNG